MQAWKKDAQVTKEKTEKENKRNERMEQAERKSVDFSPTISITAKCE